MGTVTRRCCGSTCNYRHEPGCPVADRERVDRVRNTAPALLEACKALIDEHRIFLHGSQWVCPFCAAQSITLLQFPHNDNCPVVAARAAIREATGQ